MIRKEIRQVRRLIWVNSNNTHRYDIVSHRVWHDHVEELEKAIRDIKYKMQVTRIDELDVIREAELEERIYDL